MPELKRVPQEGKMNLDFHERILPPGQYREALNVNIGRSETAEVGTVENLLGNAQIGATGITGGVCIGSYRDNGNERIYYFVTSNNSFDESNGGEHGIFEFDQTSGTVRTLVSGSVLNFHQDFLITGINLIDNLLFWTDDRNEPRKINIDRARADSTYYNSDVLMSVAKPAPFSSATIVTAENNSSISSTFLQDKLPRFSYRWRYDDGEYSVLAPFTPIVFQPPSSLTVNSSDIVNTGEVSGYLNSINFVTLSVPVTTNAGITDVELIYKDTNSSTLYIVEDKPVTTESAISFDYMSQDPFRTLPPSQLTRVFDNVPRRAKAQELAGSRIVYGNYLQNYNLPTVDFSVGVQNANTNPRLTNHSVKSRRTYEVGIVLSDASGRTTPVILSSTGQGTIFVDPIASGTRQLNITFPSPSQLDGFTSYKVVVKQREQEYYNVITNANGVRNGDNANKLPIDQTQQVDTNALNRPSSRSVYDITDLDGPLLPVAVEQDGTILINGAAPVSPFVYEVEPVVSELDIFFETSTGALTGGVIADTAIPIEFYNCYVQPVGNFQLEVNRIRIGFNEPAFDVGVRAHQVNENFAGEERRFNTLIHSSGFFNSRTGLNQLNQFNESEGGLTISLDPQDGSIQLVYAEDTQLIIFQEDKVSRSPIDKDFIFSAEGGAVPVTSSTAFLGTIAAYAGEYGISRDPGSFSVYGTRKYFTDRNRGVVIRLSNDGITEISQAGLSDFFRDSLRTSTKIIGSFDEYHNQYNLTIRGEGYPRSEDTNRATATDGYFTVGFEEDVTGWVSFKSFAQESGTTLNNRYYTFNGGNLWEHNREDVSRNNFYGVQHDSHIDFIFNDNPSVVKDFKTIGYEGSSGWTCDFIDTDIDNIGNPPTPSTNFVDASLSIAGGATNTISRGEATNVVDITEGTTQWIVVVSPINNQYVIQDDGDQNIQLNPGNGVVVAERSLQNGNLYFRITGSGITSENRMFTVTLSGAADLAFAVTLFTINIIENVNNATLQGDVAREFTVANTNVTEDIVIIADERYYIEPGNITVDSSQIASRLQPGQGITVSADGRPDDVLIQLPIITPSSAVGVSNITISGDATLKPLLTWRQNVANLNGYQTVFSRQFDPVTFPISPRDPLSERQGTYSVALADVESTTDIILADTITANITNGTLSAGLIDVTLSGITYTATSNISNADTITTITVSGNPVQAQTTGLPDILTFDYLNSDVTTNITTNVGLVLSTTIDGFNISTPLAAGSTELVTGFIDPLPAEDVTVVVDSGAVDSGTVEVRPEVSRLTSINHDISIQRLQRYRVDFDADGVQWFIYYPSIAADITDADITTPSGITASVTGVQIDGNYKRSSFTLTGDGTETLPANVMVAVDGITVTFEVTSLT